MAAPLPPPLHIGLPDLTATQRLASRLAVHLATEANPPAVLLSGPMGAGKTTFCAALVAALPGGERADVASPSFNLANHYPTIPPVLHVDLYRLSEEGVFDFEELEEALDDGFALVLIEWGEFLPAHLLPLDRLALNLGLTGGVHTLEVHAHGESAHRAVGALARTAHIT